MRIYMPGNIRKWIREEAQRAHAEGRWVPADILTQGETDLSPSLNLDTWSQNVRRLSAILIESEASDLPGSVRGAVEELFQALAFGNYYSAIALCRAVLESVLIDRSGVLGYDPYDHEMRPRKLEDLIALAAASRSTLDEARMQAVRRRANFVLHERTGTRLRDEDERRETAFDAFESLREALEELY